METIIAGLARMMGALPLATASGFSALAAAKVVDPFMWYVTRAAATSSYITLSLLVILGLARSMTRISGGRIAWWLDESHQFLALLTAFLTGAHLISLMFDALMPFSLIQILAPFTESYRPIPIAIGVFSMYGMVAVLASSWLRKRVGHSAWRLIHYISFAVFAGVTLHGILAGSDSSQPWMIFIYVSASIAVVLLTFIRMFTRPEVQPARAGAVRRY